MSKPQRARVAVDMSFGLPEKYDQYRQPLRGDYGNRTNGFVAIKQKGVGIQFSNGDGWEHVSVSRRSSMPTYEDMCWVKDLFWSNDVCVMQLHVPKDDHINYHPFCLHLWRPINGEEIPRPPRYMIA